MLVQYKISNSSTNQLTYPQRGGSYNRRKNRQSQHTHCSPLKPRPPGMMVEYTCGIPHPPTPLTASTSWIYEPVMLMIKGSPHSAHFLDLIGFIFWFFERTDFLDGGDVKPVWTHYPLPGLMWTNHTAPRGEGPNEADRLLLMIKGSLTVLTSWT